MNRRQFFKAGIIGIGAGVGYVAGKSLLGLGGGLEGAVNALYNVAHDALTEFTGAAEERLKTSAQEVKEYLTLAEDGHQSREAYWKKMGLLDEQDVTDLNTIFNNVERYTQESNLPERLTRLYDRLTKRFLDTDQQLEQHQSDALRNFNERFSKQIKGEKRGSREALEDCKLRLDSLVRVYDLNQDTKLAQAALLDKTQDYFTQAQRKVLEKVDSFLTEDKFTSSDERDYFLQMKQLAQEDPTGRKMADYVLGIGNTLSALQANSELGIFRDKIRDVLDNVHTLQDALDKGITLKNDLRKADEHNLDLLRHQTEEFTSYITSKKKELETQGHAIDYETLPRLRDTRDGVLSILSRVRNIGGMLGAGLGGLVGYTVSQFALRPSRQKSGEREKLKNE